MKTTEMNQRQRKAYHNVCKASNYLLGGLENTLSDYPENSDEYKNAYELLNNHDHLVKELYNMAISDIYEDGACFFGRNATSWLRDIRFCGKAWLMERCEKRITKEGY